jgi:elongation factor P--(R)-beta-lysine ligase
MPYPIWHPERLAARLPFLRRRTLLTQATRAFFTARGYTEVETQYVVPTPGEEVHLRAFATRREHPDGTTEPLWLHTSPEFAMKKLLVVAPGQFFNSPASGATVRAAICTRPNSPCWSGIAQAPPVGADLLGTAEDAPALATAAGVRLRDNETWEDLFFRLLLARIEPRIGRAHPTFLTHWPAAQAALARRDRTDPRVAERFELFVCGIELANAFVELTDAAEQRARFEADRARRHALSGAGAPDQDWQLDEDFLAALAHGMPQAAGIALGFDRLAMIASGAERIDQVLWL